MTTVVLIRQFDTPKTAEDLHAAADMTRWCLDLYRVAPRMHLLAADGSRCACVFEAPDAEAMRNVLRSATFGLPLGLWPATVHPGPDDDASDNRPPSVSGTLAAVERIFPQSVVFAEVQALEDRNIACLNLHRVRFVRSYFSTDRRNMICLYEAPDAESVRLANKQAGLPFERVWPVQVVVPRVQRD